MKQVTFIYGNQEFEVKEQREKVIDSLLKADQKDGGLFRLDAADFFKRDKAESGGLLEEFQNTCETVSFLSPKIVFDIFNLQEIRVAKSASESIEKEIRNLRLEERLEDGEVRWYEEGLTKDPAGWISGGRIVTDVVSLGNKSFYLEIAPNWLDRAVYANVRGKEVPMSLKEFLRSKLKTEITFDPQEESGENQGAGRFLSVLKDYVKNPPDQVFFVLSANLRKPTELKGKLYDLLKKHAREIKTTVSYDDFNPVPWVIQRGRDRKLEFDTLTASLLIELAGSELSILDAELEKLSLLLPPDTRIEESTLLESVSHSKAFTIFRAANFLTERNLSRTLESLEQILSDKAADTVGVLGLIASQFRRLLKISWLDEEGYSEREIASRLRLSPWLARELVGQATNFSARELENIVIYLTRIDLPTKFAGKDGPLYLENTCFQICQGGLKKAPTLESRWTPE